MIPKGKNGDIKKSWRKGKKIAVYQNGWHHFGDSSMEDFRTHKSEKRRDAYYARHKKSLTGNSDRAKAFRIYSKKTWQKGGKIDDYISIMGYKRMSPFVNEEKLLINTPDGAITMKDVDFPILAISEKGEKKIMLPEKEYSFKGKKILEIPMKKTVKKAQKGMSAYIRDDGTYVFGDREYSKYRGDEDKIAEEQRKLFLPDELLKKEKLLIKKDKNKLLPQKEPLGKSSSFVSKNYIGDDIEDIEYRRAVDQFNKGKGYYEKYQLDHYKNNKGELIRRNVSRKTPITHIDIDFDQKGGTLKRKKGLVFPTKMCGGKLKKKMSSGGKIAGKTPEQFLNDYNDRQAKDTAMGLGISKTAGTVANMILPGSGFIVEGVGNALTMGRAAVQNYINRKNIREAKRTIANNELLATASNFENKYKDSLGYI